MKQLFFNATQVVTCAGPARARRGTECQALEILSGAAVVVDGALIVAVGPNEEIGRAHV